MIHWRRRQIVESNTHAIVCQTFLPSRPSLRNQVHTLLMDESLRAQIDTYLPHLEGLIQRGRRLHDTLAADPSTRSALAAARVWQQDCGITVNQLSGGSKAHWLARSFSEAFLVRSAAGSVVEGVAPAEIVGRLIGVLEQAVTSLSGMRDGQVASPLSEAAPSPRRFDFVHNPEIRPVVEEAYAESRRALDQGRFGLALFTSCGILEAIVTDALEHRGLNSLVAADMPAGKIADWPFETRIAVAEKVGLIHGGCARLPPVARRYRDLTNADGERDSKVTVSDREARQAAQVLHVVMRDLDPGR
jgi:hypothetical protein